MVAINLVGRGSRKIKGLDQGCVRFDAGKEH